MRALRRQVDFLFNIDMMTRYLFSNYIYLQVLSLYIVVRNLHRKENLTYYKESSISLKKSGSIGDR